VSWTKKVGRHLYSIEQGWPDFLLAGQIWKLFFYWGRTLQNLFQILQSRIFCLFNAYWEGISTVFVQIRLNSLLKFAFSNNKKGLRAAKIPSGAVYAQNWLVKLNVIFCAKLCAPAQLCFASKCWWNWPKIREPRTSRLGRLGQVRHGSEQPSQALL